MREIKFRGRRLDNGEWVYGYYFAQGNGCDSVLSYIKRTIDTACVDPATIGQFTGLCDKNGKEIYEGDVLQAWRSIGKNGELRGKYVYPLPVEYCELWAQFVAVDEQNKEQFPIWQSFDVFEIIGTIHDKEVTP